MSRLHKRSPSPETQLVGRQSTYHPSVTLFEHPAATTHAEPRTSPRRSERIQTAAVINSSTVHEGLGLIQDEFRSKKWGKDQLHESVGPKVADGAIASSSKQDWTNAESGGSRKRRRDASTSPKKRRAVPQELDIPHPSPPRWQEAYDKIKEMRSRTAAPVDTMGAGAAQLGETIPKNQRFATLVSLMLSSQTKDEVTSAAVRTLREALGGSVSVDAVLAAETKTISEAICKVGFWRRKTDYIKRTAQRLHDEYDGDIPKTVDELCALPGVGPKMAILALHVGWKLNAGVGVDVHVHRITNRLGWHDRSTKTPEQTRLNLQSWLPHDLRPTFTGLLVGFGQTICLPISPRCESCDLSSDGLCRLANTRASGRSDARELIRAEEPPTTSGPLLQVELE